MSKVNKFNIRWQIARVHVKKYYKNDAEQKLQHIMRFLKSHPSRENQLRVLNWVSVSMLGMKCESTRMLYREFKDIFASLPCDREDEANDFFKFCEKDLILVYIDLMHRTKNGYKNSNPPIDHINFMVDFTDYLYEYGLIEENQKFIWL